MTVVARETTNRPLRIRSAGARAIAAEPSERQLLSVAEAARLIGVAHKTIRRYIDQNRLRAHRFGPNLLRIELDDLLELATAAHPGSNEERAESGNISTCVSGMGTNPMLPQ